MGENYIHINDIVSVDMGNGRRETSAEYQICILGMNRKTVVGILSKLLEHMEISPLEILLYRDSHNSSDDRNTGFKIVPEFLEFIDGLGTEGDDNPSVSGGAADSRLRRHLSPPGRVCPLHKGAFGGRGMMDIKKARRCGNTDELRDVKHHEDISYYPQESASCQGGGW